VTFELEGRVSDPEPFLDRDAQAVPLKLGVVQGALARDDDVRG
jgi:hypothetical protein